MHVFGGTQATFPNKSSRLPVRVSISLVFHVFCQHENIKCSLMTPQFGPRFILVLEVLNIDSVCKEQEANNFKSQDDLNATKGAPERSSCTVFSLRVQTFAPEHKDSTKVRTLILHRSHDVKQALLIDG